ncbi:MAG TPA: DegT/DnrJ/EryC1/StrS family aminotransferase [Bacteroidota bacterium]|nr:DegT/DnrJ/EryC1/StrS family aminotransferase [Bacteroidota bacterium]
MMNTRDKKMVIPSDLDRTGRDLGSEELEVVGKVLETGCLFSPKGTYVHKLETEFAGRYGRKYAHACSSGSAAVHIAVGAINPNPGDEIVTTSVTDMGALTAILYQGAIPVFCDVDPDSYNVTAETIEKRITNRTKAVIVTHLFGIPCEMGPIMELCNRRGIPVIEDCAQAFDATYEGKPVGTFGKIGCFSFQQGKHMTTGEGGMVVSDDPELARRMFLFINKAWGYGDKNPDHYFLAPNYRINEITGGVALAQLAKLTGVVARRRASAARFTSKISHLSGISPQKRPRNSRPVFWKYCVNIDEQKAGASLNEIAASMREGGISAAPRYIGKPAFECKIFKDKVTFGNSSWPYTDPSRSHLPPVDYDSRNFPGTMKALSQVLVIPWNEFYTDEHVDYIAARLQDSVPAAVEAR